VTGGAIGLSLIQLTECFPAGAGASRCLERNDEHRQVGKIASQVIPEERVVGEIEKPNHGSNAALSATCSAPPVPPPEAFLCAGLSAKVFMFVIDFCAGLDLRLELSSQVGVLKSVK